MTPTDVINAFYQKGENDCTTLGTIKAAIAKFGINNVFVSSFDASQQIYSITFKNGNALSASKSQLDDLKQFAGFEPNLNNDNLGTMILEYALFCFGVFVLNYAKLNRYSVQESLFHIDTKGINSDNSHHYLGFSDTDIVQLTENAGTKDPTAFVQEDVYILSNFYHTVMASFDNYDEYGTPISVMQFAHNHSSIFHGRTLWAYKFI